MEKKAIGSGNFENSEADIEQTLWSSLLHAEGVHCSWKGTEPLTEEMLSVEENPGATVPYPWNPSEPEAEGFFTDLEQGFSLDEWDEQEVSSRADSFFANVNQLWSTAALQETLAQRFAAHIPQPLLAKISNRAQQVLSASQSLADQLVHCVQDVLPNLAADDLYVLARPLAFAMRNGESRRAVDSTLEKVRPVNWEDLSEIEQARLSLAIARCALLELEAEAQK